MNVFSKGLLLALALPLVGLSSIPLAIAQSEKSINDIIRSLAPIKGQVISEGYGQREKAEGRDVIVVYKYSEDLEIYFPFDSARITDRARRQLDILGKALVSERLKPYRYLIAGHTDAKGSEKYNQALSRRRAFAVKRYLYRNFPIKPDRLVAVGWGESRLKDRKHPYAAINRRVQIIMIAPKRVGAVGAGEDGARNGDKPKGKRDMPRTKSGLRGADRKERAPEVEPDGKLRMEW